ncbi:DUF547 domain-containing protein [Magnetococcales bacterium HHB-1]
MWMITLKRITMLSLMLIFFALPLHAQEPSWEAYRQLLNQHVSVKKKSGIQLNWVNYSLLKSDPKFAQVVETIAQFSPLELSNKNEKLAFYINAYNILAMKVVLDHWPIKSIKDVGSFFRPVWKVAAGKIGGEEVTLHQVEHEILRKMGEPRIHMAIVCASLSCPDLRAEPFEAKKLSQQLNDQSQNFINNRAKGVYITGNTVHVSKIFDWFEEDFGDVLGFIRRWHKGIPSQARWQADIDYHWQLNGQ